MEKGKYVTRSIYQKVVEKNKLLLHDIRILVSDDITPEFIEIRVRWKKKFEQDRQFQAMLKEWSSAS